MAGAEASLCDQDGNANAGTGLPGYKNAQLMAAAAAKMELTRERRASRLAPEDTFSSWTNGRKNCVS